MKNKYIVCQRTFTYDLEQIVNDWKVMNGNVAPTDEEIWELVKEWAEEDMRSPASRHDITWVDEDGNPLD